MMRPSTGRGCLAEEPAEAGRQSARQRVHHAWGTAPKPTGKGAEGTENPELAHRLHQQKI